jgi:hypothetical protein
VVEDGAEIDGQIKMGKAAGNLKAVEGGAGKPSSPPNEKR